MNKNLRFSHKILLAASLIVIAAFSLFTLYNDYLQRNAIRHNLDNYLNEMGSVTANNIQTWLGGRILLAQNLADDLPVMKAIGVRDIAALIDGTMSRAEVEERGVRQDRIAAAHEVPPRVR